MCEFAVSPCHRVQLHQLSPCSFVSVYMYLYLCICVLIIIRRCYVRVCRLTRQNPAPPAESLLIRAFKQLPSKSSLFYPRPLSLPALQSLVRHQKAKRNQEQKFLPETTQSSSTLPFPPSTASAWLTRSRELFFEAFPPFEASHWQSTQSDAFASLAPIHYPGELVSQ